MVPLEVVHEEKSAATNCWRIQRWTNYLVSWHHLKCVLYFFPSRAPSDSNYWTSPRCYCMLPTRKANNASATIGRCNQACPVAILLVALTVGEYSSMFCWQHWCFYCWQHHENSVYLRPTTYITFLWQIYMIIVIIRLHSILFQMIDLIFKTNSETLTISRSFSCC